MEFFDANLASALRLCFREYRYSGMGIAHNLAVPLRLGGSILAARIMLYATSMRGRAGVLLYSYTILDLSFGKLVQLGTYGGPQ